MDENSYKNFKLEKGVHAGFLLFHPEEGLENQNLLNQVHGAVGVNADLESAYHKLEADYLWTTQNKRLGVCVADCTAILVTGISSTGDRFVSAIHAGWRGTAENIIQKAFQNWKDSKNLKAWLSPSICQEHFEVGPEVREAFPQEAFHFFKSAPKDDRLYFDLRAYQIKVLESLGTEVSGWGACTVENMNLPSYRRDGPSRKTRLFWWICKT